MYETPSSLGNLLILPKKNHTINAVSEGAGGNLWKMPCLPPSIYIIGGGGMLETYPFSHIFPNHSLLRRWGRLRSGRSNWKLMALAVNGPMGNTDLWWNFPKKSPFSWNLSMTTCQEFGHASKNTSSPNCRLSAWHSPAHCFVGMEQGQI